MKRRMLAQLFLASVLANGSVEFSSPVYAEEPDKLNVAIILSAGLESSWDGGLIEAFKRVQAERPHGLEITWQYTDPLWGDEAGDAMQLFADIGGYDIIWAHSTYSDQVRKVMDDYPDTMFVVVGSGNEGLGKNQYWIYKRVHEAAYVLGILAGSLTETDVLGVVGTYPAADTNDSMNAFFEGARSVNPDIRQKVAFIESWYDPGKAAEMTSAQIATGADLIYTFAGNFKPCEQAKILCFSHFADDAHYSPGTILSSTLALWDPDIHWIIDEWWEHKVSGKPFTGNTDIIWRGMKEGGAGVAPFHELENRVPAEVKAHAEQTIKDIVEGRLQVNPDASQPESN